jgi:error-prone DNA polymerase
MTKYVELHARSAFSFLEGASSPEEMAAVCAELGMPAMALLDSNGVYGAPRLHMAMKRVGLRGMVGAEITAQKFGCVPFAHQREPHRSTPRPGMLGTPISARLDPSLGKNKNASLRMTSSLPLLVESRTGYQNLCRLITKMKLRVPKHAKPGECAATEDELREHAEGLVCLTGDEHSPLAAALEEGGAEAGQRCIERLLGIFGERNLYIEVQRHYDRHEEARNQAAIELARSYGLPLLATNAPCYAQPQQREILDLFTCIRNHTRLDLAGKLLAKNSERHLKSPQAMARLFADLPEAIANTKELSDRLQFSLTDLGYEFPKYPVPEGETMASFLRKRTEEGARVRYLEPAKRHLWQRAQRQIEREMGLITKLGLEGYFLIVWDMIRFCREQGILVQGRGSAANSAVCYSLGITAVDPIGMDLLFERFLSEERGEWPDIDLDLPSGDDREKAIQYLYQRYGKLGAAMTANVITYRGRSAAREVGKALGFDGETLERVSSMVGSWEYKAPDDTMESQFRQAGCDLRHPRIRKFFELCLAVQELPRHLGQHSGGMVICQGQLDSVVPLEPASMPGRVVVQWDKDDCADMGIIKVDLLGLGMMAVLKDTINIIRDDYSETVDLAQLPADDPAVYATLQKADTIGMFQVESRAQMSCLPRLHPVRFYDIVVQVAIIRPGPIVGKMVNPYLKRRQGREQVTYAHPALEPVLERTLGIPLFQEQLLRMAMIVANFTGGEAEELRRALGSNRRLHERMREVETKLRRGMTINGIGEQAQDEIVQSILSFALYGFPESHAASFALLAYASAYLKVHYLAAFTAAMLNNQPMGFYHSSTIVKDAQRHGLTVLPIDVMRSEWQCTLENGQGSVASGQKNPSLRIGLRYVKGLREEAGRALVQERERAPFTSIEDLARRVPELRKNELESLAAIGGLSRKDSNSQLSGHRREALWQVAAAGQPVGPLLQSPKREATHKGCTKDLSVTSCSSCEEFFPTPETRNSQLEICPLLPMSDEERLVADYRGTGMTVGPHPMAYRRNEMQQMGVHSAIELQKLPNGKRLKIAGNIICRQRPGTAHGFVFLSLEDETGIANAIITPDLFEKNRLLLVREPFLLIEGTLQHLDNVISVKAEILSPLNVTKAQTSSHDFH